MKETVRQTSHPWLVGIAVAAIAGAYFFFVGSGDFSEPGANLQYDVETYAELDNVPTRFAETSEIDPGVEDPRGLAVVPDGFYVAGKDAVVKFDTTDSEVGRFAIEGTPNCVHVADDGMIFVGYPRYVEMRKPDGTLEAKWAPLADNSYITSIATIEDEVYVADAGKRVVLRYDRAGEIQVEIGRKDERRDIPGIEVPSPYLDLAVNDEGHLWVVNPGKLGLERYRANGDIVTSWYRPTLALEGFSGCCNPTQIAFTSDGRLVTGEKGLVRLKMYEVTMGAYEELVAGSSLFARAQSISDLAVDARDRILVLDPRSESIRVFDVKEGEDGPEIKSARVSS